jgi:uncharacterized protein
MRSKWFRLTGIALGVLTLAVAGAHAAHRPETPKKHKIVYHLSEPGVEKAKFVLRNIQNHVDGVRGWQHIEALELVVHGPALKTFVAKTIDPDVKRATDALRDHGLEFGACGNTMKAFDISLEELPMGAKHLPQGGVVRLMELQELGYAYIRP